MKLRKLLYENVLNEFNKNEIQAIATKLKIDRSPDLEKILNKLKSQGLNYKELKLKLGSEIKSIEDLNSLVSDSKSNTRKVQKQSKEVILDNDKFFIVSPKSTEASCYYGKGTKWCTSADDENMFDNYTEKGVKLYYIFDKNKKDHPHWRKVAIAVFRGGEAEGYDAGDHEINIESYLKQMGLDDKLFKTLDGAPMFIVQEFAIAYLEDGRWNWERNIKGVINLVEWLPDFIMKIDDGEYEGIYLNIDGETDSKTQQSKNDKEFKNEQEFVITIGTGQEYVKGIRQLMYTLDDIVSSDALHKPQVNFNDMPF